jgi:hypothetical protein
MAQARSAKQAGLGWKEEQPQQRTRDTKEDQDREAGQKTSGSVEQLGVFNPIFCLSVLVFFCVPCALLWLFSSAFYHL